MAFDSFLVCCVIVAGIQRVHLIVPPKTPVLSGFEPAAIGSYRELVCDASQPGAGTITYEWYKYSIDNGVEDWESKGPISTRHYRYVFNPVTEKRMLYPGHNAIAELVSGKYKCRASNSAGTRDSEWGDFYVYEPCSLYTVSVSTAKPAIGSTFNLNCHIPNPSGFAVTWLKRADASSAAYGAALANNKGCHAPSNSRYSWSSCSPPSISSKIHTFNLQVTNAHPADSAYWICKDIGLSCDSNPVKPVVQAIPGTPQITGFPSGPVTTGTQLNLKCVASPQGDTYVWYKDGTKVTTSLTYDFYVTKESVGVYKCEARNAVGSAASSNKTLVVYNKPDSVVVSSGKTSSVVGEKDKFTCTVSGGYPTPNVTIYFKRSYGTLVEVAQGQDRVMAKEDNQAEYYCEANVSGHPALDMTSTRKTYNVTFAHTKVSFLNNPIDAVQAGQVKKFTCATDESNPITYIKWYEHVGSSWRDITTGISSSERNGVYGGKIRISEWSVTATKAINSAMVRCQALYHLTGHEVSLNAESTMFVKWSATEVKMVGKPNVPITAGDGSKIKCETDSSNSGSPGTISWYGNGQQITTGDTPSTRQALDGGTIYISELNFTARKEDNQVKFECKINYQANFRKDVTITVYFPPNGIHLSETNITVKEGVTKTITCSTTSSSNPAVSGVSVKKRLGSSEVDATGTSRVTDGTYYGKDFSLYIKVDTNRKDNGAHYICTFVYASNTFKKTATVSIQFNPSIITMLQKPSTAIHEGKPITIVCETDSANPVADIQFHRKRQGGTWEQVNSGITSEDRAGEYKGMIRNCTLTFTAKRLDSRAVVKCEVKEGSFHVEQTTTVNIYFPPATTLSSSPNPVKEGDKLTLTCLASGGNPTSYTYKWFYKNREIPNETSKEYYITSIKYTYSGTYRCQAINYSPDGKADGAINVDVLYRAKLNPLLQESLTVRSKVNTAVTFTLHVIANPLPTTVTWFHPNQKTAFFENFTQTKVNDTTYTLSKTSVRSSDYGNYTVNVTNAVGVSSFVFELKLPGPPQTPCCLKTVNFTALSATLTFKSKDNGGSPQTFTIERREPGGYWVVAAKNIADPGFNQDVLQKIAELRSNRIYEFRIKAVNDDGESAYGNVLEVKTPATPNTALTVSREGGVMTVTWTALKRSYSKVQIKYCQRGKSSTTCSYYHLKDQAATTASFDVDVMAMYDVYLEVFDGVHMVYRSAPVVLPSRSGVNAGMIAGVVVTVVILIAVLVAVVVLLHRRNMACFSDRNKRKAEAVDGDIVMTTSGPDDVVHDTFYMNVDNKAFQCEDAPVEPVYLNDPGNQDTINEGAEQDKSHHEVDPQRVEEVTYDDTTPMPLPSDGNPQRKIEDISVADFKQWLLSKRVTESTYKHLAKNGFKEASIFAMLQPAHIEKLQIKPLGQEVLVQNLVKSFLEGIGTESGRRMKPAGDGDGDESAYEELENPYAELNITPDVIASQTYAELKA